jgi:hypothetical protein
MKFVSFLFLACYGFIAMAQHSTLQFSDSPINLQHQSILIVPFQSHMYLSEVNHALAEHNKLDSEEIYRKFNMALDQSLFYSMHEKCDVTSFYQLDEKEIGTELKYIYDHIKLEYELVDAKEDNNAFQKLKNKLKKEEEQRYDRGGLVEGQLITTSDPRQRYMKAVVENQGMLDSMHYKFDNRFFLFINQLDIRNVYGDAVSMQSGYEREIKVHYTLYLKNGEILSTGISASRFPSHENDIDLICRTNFPIIARQITAELFPGESVEDKKPVFNSWRP